MDQELASELVLLHGSPDSKGRCVINQNKNAQRLNPQHMLPTKNLRLPPKNVLENFRIQERVEQVLSSPCYAVVVHCAPGRVALLLCH